MSTNLLTTNYGSSFDKLNDRKNAPVAAFYFNSNKNSKSNIPIKWTDKIKNTLKTSIGSVQGGLSNFDAVKFAKSFASCCATDAVLNNSVTVLYYILNSKPLKSSQKLNLFFHNYAPVINMNLGGIGYSNFDAMRLAISNGTVDSALFCQGLADAFDSIRNESQMSTLRTRYDEVLPVDVVVSVGFDYQNPSKTHRVSIGDNNMFYNSTMDKVLINLSAKIQNSSGSYLYSDTYIKKLIDCMINSTPVMLRIGKNIYRDCKIEKMNPKIDENVYSLSLNMVLSYII